MSHICYDWPGLLDSGSKMPTLSNSRFLEKYNFSQITGWAYLTRSFKSIAFLLGEKKEKKSICTHEPKLLAKWSISTIRAITTGLKGQQLLVSSYHVINARAGFCGDISVVV